ncbi:HD domain-containing protein, partial [bacterium]
VIGSKILSGSSSHWLQLAEEIALTHHERFDGTGYPHQLKGEEIPIVGRIVAVADVYDALTHERPYKAAWSKIEAIAEIKAQSGSQFDDRVIKAFLTSVN